MNDSIKKYVLVAVLGLFCVNAIILDIYLLIKKQPVALVSDLQRNNTVVTQTSVCPQSCVDLFHTTSSVTTSSSSVIATQISPTPTLTLTPTPTTTPIPSPVSPTSAPVVKEFFVPLGSGVGNASDWTTMSGIGASIDPANYGQIANVYFEVTVRIPTGSQTVNVRLYNANTYQSIANSEVSISDGTATILVSKSIALLQGKNLYQVQVKTQLQKDTYIDQARIRIVTK